MNRNRTCGNPDCKNYGKGWDFNHHSVCPFCPSEEARVSVSELKQSKPDEELKAKCNEIVNSLQGFNYFERFRILTTLYDSFMDLCKKEGISFLEFKNESRCN